MYSDVRRKTKGTAMIGKFNTTSNRGTETCGTCGKRRQRANIVSGFTPPLCTDCYEKISEENARENGEG